MRNSFKTKILCTFTSVILVQGALAEEEPSKKGVILETVVVVAEKQSASIQEVPISISVLDSDFIKEWSIGDLNAASTFAPNVKIAEAGYFMLPRIRGFGTNQNNKAFESPAGVAIDGIPHSRLEYFNAALFDTNRIEIYRGPQGTNFGKNTTAGLVHILTNNPTSEYTGYIDAQNGQYNRRRYEGAFSGPLINDFVDFRIAALKEDRDGFIDNTAGESLSGAPNNSRGVEKDGVRLKLDFFNLWDSSLLLTIERFDSHHIGSGTELFDVADAFKEAVLRYDSNTDFTRGNGRNTINDADFRSISLQSYKAEWKKNLYDWRLTALAGFSDLRSRAALDTDGTPVPAIFATDSDRSPTKTFEFRAASPMIDGFFGVDSIFGWDLGESKLLAGAYYQNREIQGDGIGYKIGASYLDLFLAGFTDSPSSQVPGFLVDIISPLYPVPSTALNLLSPTGEYSEEASQHFDQEAEVKAVFTNFEWAFSDHWALEYGVRYDEEEKSASFSQVYSDKSSAQIILPLFGVNEYSAEKSRSESNVAQKVSLNFQPSDETGIFFHVARGYRSGGYNSYSFSGADDELMYEPEEAVDYGIDIKTTLLDGSMQLNLSFFRIVVKDFQVLVAVSSELGFGVGSSKVENAAKAQSQGMEFDVKWAPTQWLKLIGSIGVNDTEYLDFSNNFCFPDNKNTDGDEDSRCDATGKPFPLTPKYTGSLLSIISVPLSKGGLIGQFGAGFDYQSEQFTNISLDDRYKQSDVARWRASLGLTHLKQGWSLRIVGENLTNEKTVVRQGQVIQGAVIETTDAPRMIYGNIRYQF